MRILIVEDERNLANILKKGLEESSYSVDLAFDGEQGLYMAETYPFDAIILDIMLPIMDGLTVLNKLRAKKIDVPVIMLTALGEIKDKISGLDKGADDYISKPFDFLELLSRLRAVIRRNCGQPSSVIIINDLIININSQTVIRGDNEITLSATEYKILEYFVMNSNKVISRTELIEHVYDTEFDLDSNVIDVYINYIRKKIDKGYDSYSIQTVRGAGYILRDNQ